MFGRILLPMDGPALAERALPYAVQVAAATGASVHLVRVVEPPTAGSATAAPVPATDAGEAVRAVAQAPAPAQAECQRCQLTRYAVGRHQGVAQQAAAPAVVLAFPLRRARQIGTSDDSRTCGRRVESYARVPGSQMHPQRRRRHGLNVAG